MMVIFLISRSDLFFGVVFFFSLIITAIVAFSLFRGKPAEIVQESRGFQEIHQPELMLADEDFKALTGITNELKLASFDFLDDFIIESKDFIRVMINHPFGIYAEMTLRDKQHDYSNLSFLTFLEDGALVVTSHIREENFDKLERYPDYKYEYVPQEIKVAQMFARHMQKLLDLKKIGLIVNEVSKQDYIERRLKV